MKGVLAHFLAFVFAVVSMIGIYSFSAELIQNYSQRANSNQEEVATLVSLCRHPSNVLEKETTLRGIQQPSIFFRTAYKYSSTKLSLADFSKAIMSNHTFEVALDINQFTQHLFSLGASSYLPYLGIFIL